MTREGSAPLIVGLTGTIGSGKSTAAVFFAQKGALVIDADILAREVVEPGEEGLLQIKEVFGNSYLLPTGALDRKKLGGLVFSDSQARRKLESILHPLIRKKFVAAAHAFQLSPTHPVLIYVVPLLFEKGVPPEIQKTILISSSDETAIKRITQRDGYSEEHARARIRSQLATEEKKKRADFIIDNEGSLTELYEQLEEVWKALT